MLCAQHRYDTICMQMASAVTRLHTSFFRAQNRQIDKQVTKQTTYKNTGNRSDLGKDLIK